METKALEYKTINRAVSNQEVADGWLEELINLRHRNGKLQPVLKPADSGLKIAKGVYRKGWHHDQDGVSNFIGQRFSGELDWIDTDIGSGTLIKSYSSNVSVTFLKRFMIVSHEDGMDIYLYQDNAYRSVVMPSRPIFDIVSEIKMAETDGITFTSIESILGLYYKEINEQSNDNFHTGGIMFRAAFKMFDGNYVLHTIPQYINLGTEMFYDNSTIQMTWGGLPAIKFWVSKMKIYLDKSLFVDIDSKIFTSLCIFACKNEEMYDISIDTFPDEERLFELLLEPYVISGINFNRMFDDISEKFTDMPNSASWYLVHEVDMETIQETNSSSLWEDIDLKKFYQDYATRETLPVDNFSHHKLAGMFSYNYNSRLIIGDTSTMFGNYNLFPLAPINQFTNKTWSNLSFPVFDNSFFPSGYPFVANRNCKIVVTIAADSGDIKKVYDAGSRPFAGKDGKEWIVLAASVLGYPDARAKKITILTEKNGIWYNISETKLTKSKYGNYAYFVNDSFSILTADTADMWKANFNPVFVGTDYPGSKQINIADYTDEVLKDENRIQISELSNPFVFPAENSYQIGTGKVLACASNAEPLSTGQFGEYPLNIFTSKGIWSLLQGSGDVLFSNISPVNGEVAINTDNIVSIGVGVIYTTDRGVYIISGRSVQELTMGLYCAPNLYLKAYENFKLRVNHTQLVQLEGSLCKHDAKVYASGSKVAYDKKNNELILTNPGLSPDNEKYTHSFVYSFDSNGWHKINDSYELIIYSYPNLFAISSNDSDSTVYEVGKTDIAQSAQCCIITRPMKIDDRIDFILLHRILQRCELETSLGAFAGLYVFVSNDLKTWQLSVGNDKKSGYIVDLISTRAHNKAKYFILVFAAEIREGNSVGRVEVQYYSKLTNKIR